jgi:hypothetical protein
MKKVVILTMIFMLWAVSVPLFAQLETLHGDERYAMKGIHSGNQIRTAFWNDGMVGRRYADPTSYLGEWPINSGNTYINQQINFVGAEVEDVDGVIIHIVSEGNGCTSGNSGNADSGDSGPAGEWYTFCPLPGFANDVVKEIAMSHKPQTWPALWPDKMEDTQDPGWPGQWNGYFGKNVLNADQESYYVMDDYNNREWNFYPDEKDSSRRGLGLRGTVRGFQWSHVLVEDILFILEDVKNIGTYDHDKMNFGIMSGPCIGRNETGGGDSSDDGGIFNLEEDLGYQYDNDNLGGGGWSPVGYLGLAFFESPGNPYDGIDNDGDGGMGGGPVITADMFLPVIYNVGDDVVKINYDTFEREVVQMPANGVSIEYLNRTYTFMPGQELVEIENNLIDDNLNGIIDENNGYTYGTGADAISNYLYVGLKYKDYITHDGFDNVLIDEKRDDKIDNDGDWNPEFDDVGLDGVQNTGDFGEGDGIATSGAGTDLPGEPHIDKTDIDESDMIGLTAFNIYTPWTLYPLSNDEGLWEGIAPGYLNAVGQIGDTDVLLGSGFFPLKPQQIERFSIGLIFGYGDELFRNKGYGAQTYRENYNFAKAPNIPNVRVIAGDKKVTLLWDDFAEQSIDPILGHDFEGYRIYRSTDPGFNDMLPITDGYGSIAMRKPIAQFDLNNGIKGFAAADVEGIKFYLGNDTGLVHSYVDTNVVNGQLYYYAVTAYDHGSDSIGVAPSECNKYIATDASGIVEKGNNVVVARPEAPSAGFIAAQFDSNQVKRLPGTVASGSITYEIVDPGAFTDGDVYRITFEDTFLTTLKYPATKNFTLTNATTKEVLISKSTDFNDGDKTQMVDGFMLTFHQNPEQLAYNSTNSGWSRNNIYPVSVRPFNYRGQPTELMAADFQIIIGQVGIDTSKTYFRGDEELVSQPVNFTVLNTSLNKKIKFALRERDALPGQEGMLTTRTADHNSDELIFLTDDSLHASWQVTFTTAAGDTLQPQPGDTLKLFFDKPYLSHDVFEFTVKSAKIDNKLAQNQLDRIRVVPNPYIVANSWEPLNPYSNGRGPRELHFTHLPEKCTIRIFNIRGQLVQEIEHNTPDIADGAEIWNMQTKDLLDISYGIYIYHVDAGALGEKVGRFAIIK